LGVGPLQILVGEVAVLVPLLLLGDAEVDEGLAPDVREAHSSANVTPASGRSPADVVQLHARTPPPGWGLCPPPSWSTIPAKSARGGAGFMPIVCRLLPRAPRPRRLNRRTGPSRRARTSRPPRPRRGSPGSSPSRAPAGRAR